MMAVRLAAISTAVGTQYVRRYELAYKPSAATRRSLLTGVTLCAAPADPSGSCGVEALRATSFQYQEDPPSFDVSRPTLNRQTLGADWRIQLAGDFDGDGTRDGVYLQDTGEKDLVLTSCGAQVRVDQLSYLVGFDQPADATPTGGSADIDNDGRVDILGTQNGYLTYSTANCNGASITWTTHSTNLALASPTAVSLIDYDGDGLVDARYIDSSNQERISIHRNKDPTMWSGTDSVQLRQPTARTKWYSCVPIYKRPPLRLYCKTISMAMACWTSPFVSRTATMATITFLLRRPTSARASRTTSRTLPIS